MASNAKQSTKLFTSSSNFITVRTNCEWKIDSYPHTTLTPLHSDVVIIDMPGDNRFRLELVADNYAEVRLRWVSGDFNASVEMEYSSFQRKLHTTDFCKLKRFFNSECIFSSNGLYLNERRLQKPNIGMFVVNCQVDTVYPKGKDALATVDVFQRFSKSMLNLFDIQLLTDCILESQNETIGAHKALLVAQSPVFQAMFTNDWKESKTSSTRVVDVEFAILKEMLRFMYSCETPKNLSEIAEKLLIAANKYQLTDLKIICENSLADQLNARNICKMLEFSKMHNANKLKLAIVDYAKQNASFVIDSFLEYLTNC